MNAPRRPLIPSWVGLLALVAVGALAIFTVPRAHTAPHLGGPDVRHAKRVVCPGPPTTPACNGADAPPLGASAISPRDDCAPSCTAQDVLDYENTHPFATMRAEPVGKLTLTKIWSITSAEASGQMQGETTSLAGDARVCYVEFSGTFRSYAPVPGSKPVEHAGVALQVFDAHTGNLLVAGAG
jgi:hypothetical protein